MSLCLRRCRPSFTRSYTRHYSACQVHAQATLPLKKKHPLNRRSGEPQRSPMQFGEKKIIFIIPGIERRFLSHPSRSLNIIRTKTPWFLRVSDNGYWDTGWSTTVVHFWCDFDRASSLICGNTMPTRCNTGFYCRSYCLLNMFRASLFPSSGAQEYYTVVAACGISCCGFSSSWSSVELRVMRPGCRMLVNQHPANRTHNPRLHTRPSTWKPQHKIPHAATTV